MLEHAQGEVIAISHPEMMLYPEAMDYLYHCAFYENRRNDVIYSHLNNYNYEDFGEDQWMGHSDLLLKRCKIR